MRSVGQKRSKGGGAGERKEASELDARGFRSNVGMVLCNDAGKVLLFRRYRQESWQFPQGGVDRGEGPLEALYRELYEEVGLESHQVQLLGQTRGWLHYLLPKHLFRRSSSDLFVGQKQKWFLLRLRAAESFIDFNRVQGVRPEFDLYRWVSYWYPLREIVHFKRSVYSKMLQELYPMLRVGLLKSAAVRLPREPSGERVKV